MGDLGVSHAVHLRLIRRLLDFLLVLIELFSLGVNLRLDTFAANLY